MKYIKYHYYLIFAKTLNAYINIYIYYTYNHNSLDIVYGKNIIYIYVFKA